MNDSRVTYSTSLRSSQDCQSTANLEVNLQAIKQLIELQGARVLIISCRPNPLCTKCSMTVCQVCHGHWWLMSSWTVSSRLLNTQWQNISPIPQTWSIIDTATQKLGLLHSKVAGFKQITGEYKTVLYERTQKKPLTNGVKHCLTSKKRFWLNCLSQGFP